MGWESVPDEVLLGMCLYLNNVDLTRLRLTERRMSHICSSDKVWERRLHSAAMHQQKQQARLLLHYNNDVLGSGALRRVRQEAYCRAVARIGKVVELNSSGIALGARVYSADSGLVAVAYADGQIRQHSFSREGREVWAADVLQQAAEIGKAEALQTRKEELGVVHKNQLFQFKVAGSAREKEYAKGFALWNDDEPQPQYDADSNQRPQRAHGLQSGVSSAMRRAHVKSNTNPKASRRGSQDLFDEVGCLSDSSSTSSYASDRSGVTASSSSPQMGASNLTRISSFDSVDSSNDGSSITDRNIKNCGRGRGRKLARQRRLGHRSKSKRHSRVKDESVFTKFFFDESKTHAYLACGNPSLAAVPFRMVATLPTGEWYTASMGETLCEQSSLQVPRWSRNSQSEVTCMSQSPLLDSASTGLLGGKVFSNSSHPGKRKSATKIDNTISDVAALKRDASQAPSVKKGAKPGDKALLVTGHKSGVICIWGSKSTFLGALHAEDQGSVRAVHLDHNGIVSCHENGVVNCWDPVDMRLLSSITFGKHEPGALVVTPCFVMAGLPSGKVALHLRSSEKVVVEFQDHHSAITCLKFREVGPDTFMILSGGRDGQIGLHKYTWPGLGGKETSASRKVHPNLLCHKTLVGHSCTVRDIYVDDFRFISASDDGTIKFWDVGNTLGPEEVRALRTIKWKKGNNKVPIKSLVIAPKFVLGLRSDGSIVGFTHLSAWGDISDYYDESATLNAVSTPSKGPKKSRKPRSGKKTLGKASRVVIRGRYVRNEDLDELRFEHVFDEYDLQMMHDFHNGR